MQGVLLLHRPSRVCLAVAYLFDCQSQPLAFRTGRSSLDERSSGQARISYGLQAPGTREGGAVGGGGWGRGGQEGGEWVGGGFVGLQCIYAYNDACTK